MTITTYKLQVSKGQSHRRVIDVVRRQVNLMVDSVARLHDPFALAHLTEIALAPCVCLPAVLPGLRLIECFGELSRHLDHLQEYGLPTEATPPETE